MAEPTRRLEAYRAMLRTRGTAVQLPPSERDRFDALLAGPLDDSQWIKAYEAEEILIGWQDEATLPDGFLALRLEAESILGKDMVDGRQAAFDAAKAANTATVGASMRIAYKALAEDMHEYWAEDDERVAYTDQITRRTAKSLITVFAILLLSIGGYAFYHHSAPKDALKPTLLNFPLLIMVLASGLFGAGLSMMIGLNTRLEKADMLNLEKMALVSNRIARIAIGAGAAFLLFVMCLSKVLAGSVMPALYDGDQLKLLMEPGTLAHLVFGCVVAGFSENFVPSKIAEVEKK